MKDNKSKRRVEDREHVDGPHSSEAANKTREAGELSSDELAKVSGGTLLRGNNINDRKGGRYL